MKNFTERQWVTIAVYLLAILMLAMGYTQPGLWNIELYKVLLQAVVISGFINMVLAFHFAANKSDELRSQNTGKAFSAIEATAKAGMTSAQNVTVEGDDVTVTERPDA